MKRGAEIKLEIDRVMPVGNRKCAAARREASAAVATMATVD
jgi:hypothetical protein